MNSLPLILFSDINDIVIQLLRSFQDNSLADKKSEPSYGRQNCLNKNTNPDAIFELWHILEYKTYSSIYVAAISTRNKSVWLHTGVLCYAHHWYYMVLHGHYDWMGPSVAPPTVLISRCTLTRKMQHWMMDILMHLSHYICSVGDKQQVS